MIAVLGEEISDCEFIEIMLRRISGQNTLRVAKKGFDGCGNLLRDGARHLNRLLHQGTKKFVVCIDADGKKVEERKAQVRQRIFNTAQFVEGQCNSAIVVPVQEIESWILADASALNKTFRRWGLKDHPSPEGLKDPKKVLQDSTRQHNGRPLYVPSTHNPVAAKYLDIDKLRHSCPSFAEFHAFVKACIS